MESVKCEFSLYDAETKVAVCDGSHMCLLQLPEGDILKNVPFPQSLSGIRRIHIGTKEHMNAFYTYYY